MNQFELAARSLAPVLITGPTGSGKTSIARRIHEQGARRLKPFVVVNLASLHEGTFESELFGHERGAFTGADLRRTGRLEAANGGTVFLDEIGDLSPKYQARLLEVLQSGTITPVGGNRETRLDVRILAATHRDLEKAVKQGAFREDLYHRLRFHTIRMRPLREVEGEEFNAIIHRLLDQAARNNSKSIRSISIEVARRFEAYSWPGNIRELKAVIDYAALACSGPEIGCHDLPDWFHSSALDPIDPALDGFKGGALGMAELELGMDYYRSLREFERLYLERALRRHRGRINQTARLIGMNKTTLIRRLRALDIRIEELGWG